MKKSLWTLMMLLAVGLLAVACQSQTTADPTPAPAATTASTAPEPAATSAPQQEPEPEPAGRGAGGTLNIIYWQAVSTLNPYLSGGTKDIDASTLVLEPLARYTEEGELIPWLATNIPTLDNGGISDDLTTITWTLQDGILWSDGTPLTAEDVAFTFLYCTSPETGCSAAANFANVASVEAVDALTVKITFEGPTPFPYQPFVTSLAPILQKAQFENCVGEAAQTCTEANFGPRGTGPYIAKDFRANDVVIFEPNPFYRDPNKPYFSEVVFKGGGDAESAARAVLETGESDYAWNLQVLPEILAQMELAGKGNIVAAFATNLERILINFTNPDPALGDKRSEWTLEDPNPHPFLSDIAVRQALSMAIDRDLIATLLYGAAGRATCNLIPAPAIYVSTANDSCLVQDIAGANALLDEAGWVDSNGNGIRDKDGVELRLLYQTSTNAVRQQTQELIKQWWAEIGVETELKNVSAAVFFGGDPASPDTYGKFFADVQMFTNGSTGTDPQAYLSGYLSSEISSSANTWLGNNIERWYSPEFDALYLELAQTSGIEARAEIAKQMNDLIIQDYALLPLVHRGSVSAYANSLRGVRMNPWDSEMWNIADWSRAE